MIDTVYKTLSTDIINNFHTLYKKNHWTQVEAAQLIGCDPSYISKIFSGKRNPSKKILAKMEEVLRNNE